MITHSLRAFRHRNFRLFFFGQTFGIIGYWVQQIAMAWLVYRLTGSAWMLGVTAFAGQAAVLVLAPFGGIWADRVDRRKLIIIAQATAAVPAFTLALLTWIDMVEVWHVIVLALLLGVVIAIDANREGGMGARGPLPYSRFPTWEGSSWDRTAPYGPPGSRAGSARRRCD